MGLLVFACLKDMGVKGIHVALILVIYCRFLFTKIILLLKLGTMNEAYTFPSYLGGTSFKSASNLSDRSRILGIPLARSSAVPPP